MGAIVYVHTLHRAEKPRGKAAPSSSCTHFRVEKPRGKATPIKLLEFAEGSSMDPERVLDLQMLL